MGTKVVSVIMPLMLPVRKVAKVARFSGAVVVVEENRKRRDHIVITNQNNLKIILGRKTKKPRRHIMITINSILKMHHLVKTMPIEWTTKDSRTDMTIQQMRDKINIKMRQYNKMVKDLMQGQAPSPL